jgi:hypothetical protein
MASAQAFMTYWMLRLLVKPQIARRWGSQSLDEQRRKRALITRYFV